MSIESVQKIFKTLSDPTRIRILALLEREELAVQDLMAILGMAQSRVSRHLAILRDAGLLEDRRDGTYVFYRMTARPAEGWQAAWELVKAAHADDPTAARDLAALESQLAQRQSRTRAFFDAVAPGWDGLRQAFGDEAVRARAVTRLVPPGLRVLDVGTGTGILAEELAALGLEVIAVDHSPRMLEAARRRLEKAGTRGVELREGAAESLPLPDEAVDAAFAHMVLHYLASPREAVREMARVVRPGGRVVLVDFERHDREWMIEELGVRWLGFPEADVRGWLEEAGLVSVSVEPDHSPRPSREIPRPFVATGRKPGRSRGGARGR